MNREPSTLSRSTIRGVMRTTEGLLYGAVAQLVRAMVRGFESRRRHARQPRLLTTFHSAALFLKLVDFDPFKVKGTSHWPAGFLRVFPAGALFGIIFVTPRKLSNVQILHFADVGKMVFPLSSVF